MSEVDRTLRRIKDARAHCEKIIKGSKNPEEIDDANTLLQDLSELITSMSEYTETVFDDEIKNLTRQKMIEEASTIRDYQIKCEEIERRRKSSHNDLILHVKLTDGMCRNLGISEIYGKLPEEYKKDTNLINHYKTFNDKAQKRKGVSTYKNSLFKIKLSDYNVQLM